MELWVRNQDKERLLKIKDIFLDYDGYHCNKFHLITYDDKKYEINLGTYKTKERALEVLDEIQNIIRGKYAISLDMKAALSKGISKNDAEKMFMQMAVYQMPED